MENINLQIRVNAALLEICDNLKTAISTEAYKDYVLTMLFIKYISDKYKDKKEELTKKYNRK